MKVRFTAADGRELHWDGVLWNSTAAPEMAAALNQQVLPQGGAHDGILDRAGRMLHNRGIREAGCHIFDDTGWPDERTGEGVILKKDQVAEGGGGRDGSVDDAAAKRGPQGSPGATEKVHGPGSLRPGGSNAGTHEYRLGEIIQFLDANGGIDGDEFDRWENEWNALIAWARKASLILQCSGPERDHDTKEHGVRFTEQDQRWWKFTKPSRAGFSVDWRDNGTPFIYPGFPQ
jgi:hypothetical protein